MALKGPWGTFVHIPKNAGLSVRKWLTRGFNTAGEEIGDYHGLPLMVEENTFAIVRDPITWLVSIYAYRVRGGWEDKQFVYNWPIIVSMTKWMQRRSWSDFVQTLYEHDFDPVLNVYGMYTHPRVHLYKMEHLDVLVQEMGIAQEIPVAHVTKNKPIVTEEQMCMLKHVCRFSRERYGYS
jgi:hypothetical protein